MPSFLGTPPADRAPVVARSATIGRESAAVERSPLTGAATQLRSLSIGHGNNLQPMTQYGTLSSPADAIIDVPLPPPSLQLPEPMQSLDAHGDDFAKMGKVRHIPGGPDISITQRKLFSFPKHKDLTSFTLATSRPALLKRMASATRIPGTTVAGREVNVDDIREEAIEEFFEWLESELEKIDYFYREKEEENVRRLEELDEQVQIMKNMKLADIAGETIESSSGSAGREASRDILPKVQVRGSAQRETNKDIQPKGQSRIHRYNSLGILHDTFVPEPSTSKTRRAESMPNHPSPHHSGADAHRLPYFMTNRDNYQTAKHNTGGLYKRTNTGQLDYTAHRRPINEITYRVAKRRLKLAIIEFYRGLELLKSYCHQNQEGFRKITKKFDKSTGLRTSKKFMSEKVIKSYFGTSDVLDTLIHQTEDLFCYFEKGNRKTAVQKLRSTERSHVFYGSTFRSGILLGLGFFAAVQGTVLGFRETPGDTSWRPEEKSYLLQVCRSHPRLDCSFSSTNLLLDRYGQAFFCRYFPCFCLF